MWQTRNAAARCCTARRRPDTGRCRGRLLCAGSLRTNCETPLAPILIIGNSHQADLVPLWSAWFAGKEDRVHHGPRRINEYEATLKAGGNTPVRSSKSRTDATSSAAFIILTREAASRSRRPRRRGGGSKRSWRRKFTRRLSSQASI